MTNNLISWELDSKLGKKRESEFQNKRLGDISF